MSKPRIQNNDIIAALKKSMGNISLAAKMIGVSRVTIHSRINKYPKVKGAYDEFREQAIDNAESALQRAVLNGEGWAVCFTLKTIGKNRGYIEKQEIEHSGEIEQSVVILPSNGRMMKEIPDGSVKPKELICSEK